MMVRGAVSVVFCGLTCCLAVLSGCLILPVP